DINGVSIDTLFSPNKLYRGDWSPDNSKIATSCGNGVGIIDISLEQLNCLPDNGSVSSNGLAWFSDSKNLLWCGNHSGIYITNVLNQTSQCIKKVCSSRAYLWPTISPNQKRIIVQRYDQRIIEENKVLIEGYLYIMNSDGTDEVKLEVE
ncbi:MAG: hypothetical protein ACJ76F_10190, partial [Bacteroidia bacterium]